MIGRAFPPLDDWVHITVGTPREVNAAIGLIRETSHGASR
jgi:hypothetical protein